ncbi:uncharacterized protein LOC141657200 [Silene latifolia]|uniref:uncharacterized protein LOC141657200 n=1 Tax=Silene latifolia TaxID=37657 RepID=UPI003D77BD39
MSFLAGRLAGKEAAYFFEESKHAVTRLAQKTNKNPSSPIPNPNSSITNPNSNSAGESVDVLPEILRHSLPSKIYRQDPLSDFSSNFASPKWALPNSNPQSFGVSPDVLNPLRGYVSLPQVTFGPKRWQLPTADSSVVASTANDLRQEQYTHVNPEKVRAAAEGLTHIGMAFAAATAIIFGSAALTFGLAALKLDVHSIDDIQAKAKDIFHPKFETFKEGLHPLRDWADKTSKKWHYQREHDSKERSILKELSKMMGGKSS